MVGVVRGWRLGGRGGRPGGVAGLRRAGVRAGRARAGVVAMPAALRAPTRRTRGALSSRCSRSSFAACIPSLLRCCSKTYYLNVNHDFVHVVTYKQATIKKL